MNGGFHPSQQQHRPSQLTCLSLSLLPPSPTTSKFLRLFTNKISYRIPYEDHDQCEVLLALVGAIYVAREREALTTEEDLWRLLKTIYRSPESLIEWTAPGLLEDGGHSGTATARESKHCCWGWGWGWGCWIASLCCGAGWSCAVSDFAPVPVLVPLPGVALSTDNSARGQN